MRSDLQARFAVSITFGSAKVSCVTFAALPGEGDFRRRHTRREEHQVAEVIASGRDGRRGVRDDLIRRDDPAARRW